MAERVVKVRLTAEVSSYLDNLDKVAKKTREGRTEAQQLAAQLEAQKKAFEVTGRTMVVAGGLVAAGLLLATKRAADFDAAMSNVQAATHESAENMALLREAALEAGADTVYSAREAAGAIEELSKAGVETADILNGGLNGALDLAAAGGLEVADAAGIAATTLGQFQLKGDKAAHVADLLAAGAGKAMGDVSDLSAALGQSGTVANSFGISLEETTGTLAAFASKGLLGSDAGTSFRAMLLRLANPTGEAAAKMEELGIKAYDAQGNFIGMTGLAGQLEKGLTNLTQEQRNAALAIIFGQDAIRSANILYESGAKGIAEWTKKVDDAGYAAETAEMRLDNLNGDLERLSGSFDSALISVGAAGQGPLRAVVQGITELLDGFNGMPEGGKQAVYWIGAVTGAVLLSGGTFLLAVPKVAAYKLAVGELSPTAQRAAGAVGALTKALGVVAIVTTAVAAFDMLEGSLRERLLPTAAELTNALETASSAKELFDKTLVIEDHFELKPIISDVEELESVLRTASAEGDNFFSWLNANTAFTAEGAKFNEFREQWQKLAAALAQSPESIAPTFSKIREEFNLSREEMSRLIELSPVLKSALTDQATAWGLNADNATLVDIALGKNTPKVKSSADAYQEQAEKVDGVRQAMLDLFDQINAQNDINQRAIQANADWLEGLAGITAQVQAQKDAYEEANGTLDGFTLSLDRTTASGSANAAMLAGLAGDAQAAAQAQYEVDQTTVGAEEAAKNYIGTLYTQRQRFEEQAVAAGYNADEVKALADQIFAVPKDWQTKMAVDTAQASNDLNGWVARFQGMNINFRANVLGLPASVPVGTGTVLLPERANGGILPGPPSNTDNMLAHVASGEFVVRASQTAIPANRAALEFMNRGGVIRGYASGGFVQPQYSRGGGAGPSISVAPAAFPDQITLVVDGHTMTAYVAGVANGQIARHDAASEREIARGGMSR